MNGKVQNNYSDYNTVNMPNVSKFNELAMFKLSLETLSHLFSHFFKLINSKSTLITVYSELSGFEQTQPRLWKFLDTLSFTNIFEIELNPYVGSRNV